MPACPLTALEREEIRLGIERGLSDSVIAGGLGRHRVTVNREINRNGGRGGYSAVAGQLRADRCRGRPKVPILAADRVLRAHVGRRLRAKDSPMTISIELAAGKWAVTGAVSHETIYQGIYAGIFGESRTAHLRRRRRKHQGLAPPKTHSLGDFWSIHTRPSTALKRSEVGHLEGDLIVGAYNRSALITVVDRASRYLWIAPTRSKAAADVTTSLTRLLKQIPAPLRRTLTWDQGAEIAGWARISERCGIKIYIADPRSPWQRPTNENINAHLRRYVGKSTNLNQISRQQLTAIQTRINTTPRRSLNWATANDYYQQAVTMIN